MTRIALGLMAAVILSIYSARLAYLATAHAGVEPINQPWAQNAMQFVAWNGEQWTAWIRDGSLEQRPQNDKQWSSHANVSLAFIDWQGEPWQAKVDGDAFLLAHRGVWDGAVERKHTIRYRDWSGSNQLRTVDQLTR